MNYLQSLQYKFGANPYARLSSLKSGWKVRVLPMGKDIDINPCPFLTFDDETGD